MQTKGERHAEAGEYMGGGSGSRTVHIVTDVRGRSLEAFVRDNVVPRGRRRIGKVVLKSAVAPGDRLFVVTRSVKTGSKGHHSVWVAGCAASLDAALHLAGGRAEGGGGTGQVKDRVWQVTVQAVPRVTTLMTIDESTQAEVPEIEPEEEVIEP